jgi:hypothetical protein
VAVWGPSSLQRLARGRLVSHCRGGSESMSGAGRLPRRLGIGVVPVQGESFPSWVDRMAVRMRAGPGWVAAQPLDALGRGEWRVQRGIAEPGEP